MSSNLFCTDYDSQLQKALSHLINYPQYLPFIGSAWDSLSDKILFIGESHYLPKTSKGKSDSKTWYTRSCENLTAFDCQHIHTRGVILDAETGKYNKAYRIFYNIKTVIQEVNKLKKSKEPIFRYFSYYNYFQRPAEITGNSINNCTIDNQIAYNTLRVLAETVKPTVIIFLSKKAFNSFQIEKRKATLTAFDSISIHQVPHPACPWWYRKNKLNNKGNGKERFTEIIKGLNIKTQQ